MVNFIKMNLLPVIPLVPNPTETSSVLVWAFQVNWTHSYPGFTTMGS